MGWLARSSASACPLKTRICVGRELGGSRRIAGADEDPMTGEQEFLFWVRAQLKKPVERLATRAAHVAINGLLYADQVAAPGGDGHSKPHEIKPLND